MKAFEFIFHGPLMMSVRAFLTIACLLPCSKAVMFFCCSSRVWNVFLILVFVSGHLYKIFFRMRDSAMHYFHLFPTFSRSSRCFEFARYPKNRFTFSTNVSLYLNCMPFRIEIYYLKHKQWMKISESSGAIRYSTAAFNESDANNEYSEKRIG